MLSVDLILIPVLGGFGFLKYCHFTRFRAIRDNGYVIFFKSAIIGFSFYGFSLLIWRASILDTSANPKISEWLAALNDFFVIPELVPILLSLILISSCILILNYVLDEDEMKKRIIRQDDDSLEMTILKVYEEEKHLLITLNSGKVYVGKVTDTYFRINDEIRSVLINPLSSGFRGEDDFKVKLNTYYGYIYQKIIDNPGMYDVKISDFSVAIRYDNITTVSPFDPEIYAEFRELDSN